MKRINAKFNLYFLILKYFCSEILEILSKYIIWEESLDMFIIIDAINLLLQFPQQSNLLLSSQSRFMEIHIVLVSRSSKVYRGDLYFGRLLGHPSWRKFQVPLFEEFKFLRHNSQFLYEFQILELKCLDFGLSLLMSMSELFFLCGYSFFVSFKLLDQTTEPFNHPCHSVNSWRELSGSQLQLD